MARTITNTPIIYPFLRWLSKKLLWIAGWKAVGDLPNLPKMIVVVAPHTSNWDFPVGLMVMLAKGWSLNWVGKHTLFKPPFGWIMHWLGGTGIDRRSSSNTVDSYVEHFKNSDEMSIVITPEGTRSPRSHWKSGFYHIAYGADVPIVLAFIDFKKREAGIGHYFKACGDIKKDMKLISEFYKDKGPKNPENFLLPDIESIEHHR